MQNFAAGSRLRELVFLTLLGSLLVVAPAPSLADNFRAGTNQMVSTFPNGSPGDGGHPVISADGRYVAFESVDRLLPTDTDNTSDIYRKDLQTGSMLIAPGESSKFFPSMSADGQKIVYMTACTQLSILPPERSCGYLHDAYVWDVSMGTTLRVGQEVVGASISGDGRWAALAAQWTCEECTSGTDLRFVETATGLVKGRAGAYCCSGYSSPAISFDGRFAVLGEGDYFLSGLYRYDRDADRNGVFDEWGKTTTIPVSFLPDQRFVSGSRPTISNDGNKIAFMALDTGVKQVPGIYLRNVSEGTTTLASRSMFGLPSPNPIAASSSLSGDGNFVALSSPNPDVAPGDFNLGSDVFIRDLDGESNELVSTSYPDAKQANSYEIAGYPRPSVEWAEPSVSLDGRFVAFQSSEIRGFLTRRAWVRDRLGKCVVSCIEEPIDVLRKTAEDCDAVCAKDALPWAPRSTFHRYPPFDIGAVCTSGGVPGLFTQPVGTPPISHHWCAADPLYTPVIGYWEYPMAGAQEGNLTVGGWDYFCGSCAGIPVQGYLAGVHEAYNGVFMAPPAGVTKTVVANIDTTSVRFDEYERDLRVCLIITPNGFDSLAQDCFGKGETIRNLSVTFTTTKSYQAFPLLAKVALLTTGDLGAGYVRVTRIDVYDVPRP